MTENENKKLNPGIYVISEELAENAKWFVVHTYSGHENKVAVTLKQRAESLGFTNRIFKIMIPSQQKVMSDDAWHVVRSTRGVTGFVGTGTTPTPIPETEVDTLTKFMKMDAPKFEAKFQVDDSVKITDGPFIDLLGKVDRK